MRNYIFVNLFFLGSKSFSNVLSLFIIFALFRINILHSPQKQFFVHIISVIIQYFYYSIYVPMNSGYYLIGTNMMGPLFVLQSNNHYSFQRCTTYTFHVLNIRMDLTKKWTQILLTSLFLKLYYGHSSEIRSLWSMKCSRKML